MRIHILLIIAALTAVFALSSYSQTTGPTKIAIVNSDAFGYEKTGITKLVNSYKALEAEFKGTTDGLAADSAKLDALVKEIQQLQGQVNSGQGDTAALRKTIEQKTDDGTRMQIDFKRRQEDAKAKLDKRQAEVTLPIVKEISAALEAYGKKNSIDMIIDVSKLDGTVLMINSTMDITDAFIKDFNLKAVGIPVK
jgi:Skp family chaperone for outer membrane proteins